MPLADLDWWRDPKGYRLDKRRQLVVRRGGKLMRHRPLDHCVDLFRIFANRVKDGASLLEFVHDYGPLTAAGLEEEKGDPVRQILDQAGAIRQLLKPYVVEPREGSGGGRRLNEVLPMWGPGLPLAMVTLRLVLDPETKQRRLRFTASTLLDALRAQLGSALLGGASFGQCQHCGELFERGRGHRRADSRFCSDEHRIAFNSLKRSTKEEG